MLLILRSLIWVHVCVCVSPSGFLSLSARTMHVGAVCAINALAASDDMTHKNLLLTRRTAKRNADLQNVKYFSGDHFLQISNERLQTIVIN